jgi:prepilin-type N-terminal cleavage/methylation domain-containing protein
MNLNKTNLKNSHKGFTIVELLIVVVVIAILAAITIVAYNGIQTRAKTSSLNSDLRNVAVKIANDYTLNGNYPASIATINNGEGFKASNNAVLTYTVDNTSDPKTFCITGTLGSISYFVNQTNKVAKGSCAGGEDNSGNAPVISGYTNKYGTVGYNTSLTPSSSIPDGSWMIVAFAYVPNTIINPPSGWTTLVPQQSMTSMQFMLFGKIKTSSDTAPFVFTSSDDQGVASSTIVWGSGAAPIANWVVGSPGLRGTNATTTTNVATSIAAPAKSLVLTVSAERTIASETNITSITNSTAYLFMAQGNVSGNDANIYQTLSISTLTNVSASSTAPVTITYPNPHASNGVAVQIALPAAN